ncbi:FAR1 DNA binding domain [Arabidopsis suecica]|nr:protein FAR-RED ELONGATED HYPOCOTYL 3 isoform X1 [Arabidopsis lyrata subsp. lyrata]KAG7566444.1 FAR1 DNA binding domain [Arabidopsis suecica]|eukprot:XP_020882000.1 protein FAR-RED ELONGATED HYPOCOTYL 3 isoform X1 [Arabidopsis lyrata subsp. lyrata]
MDFRIDNGVAAGMMMGIPVELEVTTVENHNEMGESSGQAMIEQDDDNHNELGENSGEQDEKVDPDSIPLAVADMTEAQGDEPYVGQEFESEAAAHGFYNAYATKVGFVIRVSKLSRSRHDGSPIGRQLVCNKEGYRLPSKRDKVIRQRAETRVGCKAMILIRKENSGKWVITKFVKEHNHSLMPGRVRRGCIYDQYPNEHDKIQELMQQLAAEKKRAATYKRHLEMLFEQIEQHNESLSKRIQHIVDNVRNLEQRDHQQNQQV